MRHRSRSGARFVLVAALVLVFTSSVDASRPPYVPGRSISWLELGDSYSSGEGIPDAAAPCARSKLAYAPAAANLLREQRGWTIEPEYFVACTGDTSGALFNPQTTSDDPQRPSQFEWASQAGFPAGGRADIVSYSFGGNDIGFAELIKSCIDFPTSWGDLGSGSFVGRRCPTQLDSTPFEQRMRERIDNLQQTLEDLYNATLGYLVAEGGVLVVVGYPRLFAPSTSWGAWRGGRCAGVTAADADTLGRLSEYLDRVTRNAVAEVDPSGTRVMYLSRLELYDQGALGSHSLCGGQTEWLNRITVGAYDPDFRGERSFHPNAPGHAATAEALANRLDEWFAPIPPPAPDTVVDLPTTTVAAATTVAPITSGQKYEIGDEFSADCIVAWPTAPIYTTGGIQLTMSCAGVPHQFLFVVVFYPDPNLPITPSTGTVRVHGQIVDIAESAYGYRELVVEADSVDLS